MRPPPAFDEPAVVFGGVDADARLVDDAEGEPLTAEELEALDNWRFSRRMPSRAAAIRELLKRGLSAEGFENAQGGSRSQNFGVTGESSASGLDDDGNPIK